MILTSHAVFLAGLVLASSGACMLPTNVMKLVATVAGITLAATGARDVLHGFMWSWGDAAIIAFLASMVVSTVLSKARKPVMVLPNITRSDGFLTQSLYLGMALLISQLVPADRETVLRALLLGAVWVGIVAYWQSLGKAQWALPAGATPAMMDTKVRACGTLANPLFLGGYCALLLPVATWRAAQGGRIEDLAATGLLAFTAVLSGSRAAWVGLILGMPLAFLHPSPHWPEAAIAVGGTVVIVAFGRREHLSRAGIADVLHDTLHSTQSGRRYIWGETWKQIKQRPLFGHGANQMAVRNPDPAANDFFDRAHQSLLDIAHPLGFVGVACYLAVWVVALRHAGPFLPGFVAFGIWSMGAFDHLGSSNVFWALVGLTTGSVI